MAGFDERDSTSIDQPVPDYLASIGDSIKGLRVGIVREHFDAGLEVETGKRVKEAIAVLESLGASTVEVSLPKPGSVCADLLRRRAGRMFLEPVSF